jgi:hypothetical protein
MTNPWVFSGLFCLYVVPDGEIVGEGVLLGLPNERCNSQELHICARSGLIFKFTKTTGSLIII